MKATTLVLTMLLTSSVQAFAHSGHMATTGSLHAAQHSAGDWLVVVMALLIFVPMVVPVDQESWWRESLLIPQFSLMEQWCRDTFGQLMSFVGRLF